MLSLLEAEFRELSCRAVIIDPVLSKVHTGVGKVAVAADGLLATSTLLFAISSSPLPQLSSSSFQGSVALNKS